MTTKKTYLFLWLSCIAGSLSVIPYILFLHEGALTGEIGKIVVGGMLQAAVLFGLICWLSSKIVPKTDLKPFRFAPPLQRIVYPGLIAGAALGLVLILLSKGLFGNSLLTDMSPPKWVGLIGSLYGAICEEVLLRLFLFTLFYFTLGKFCKVHADKKWVLLWTANILTALLFGLGHLPLAFKLMTPSAFEIFRILLLNGIAGLVFGWLYWSRGLWTAMAAHFVADLMIHVFFV